MAGSSSATWQLGVSRMRPPQSFPTFHLWDASPSRAAARCSFSASCSQPSVILMPPISPALTPLPPIFPTAGYVGAATVGAAAWWFLYAEDGPHVTYSQLVGRLKREDGGGRGAEGWPKASVGPQFLPSPCRLTSCSAPRTIPTLRVWSVRSLRPLSP